MSTITIHDKQFETYISEKQILQKVKEMADAINKDYEGKKPLFIPILNGAFMFASDLFKCISIQAEVSFNKLA